MKPFSPLKIAIISVLCNFPLFAISQVAINTTGLAPNSSAMLDVESTTKGVLIPRMTQAQRTAISSPATGLLIFQTDNTPGFYFNSGTPVAPLWTILITSSSTLSYVDLTSTQTAAGAKTWSNLATFNAGITAAGAAVNLNASSNFATNINTGTSTGAVNIGNGTTGGNVISIGNTVLATGITQRVGTGNFSLDGVAGSTYSIGASTTTGTINLGGTAQTGTITLGSSSGANILNIANGSGATTLNLGNVQTAGSINLGAAMTTGTITIGGTGLHTGTIGIGTGTGAQTLNFGSGTGLKTISIGGTGANIIALGNTQTAGSINLGAAMTTGTITIGGTGLHSGIIGIGTGTGAQILNFGTGGTGIKTINIGTNATPVNVIQIGGAASTTTIGSRKNTIGIAGVTNGSGVRLGNGRLTINKPVAPTVNLNANTTATVSQIIDAGIIGFASGNFARTLTFPTAQGAAGLVQALPGTPAVGDVFTFLVFNTGTGLITLAPGTGTGVTIANLTVSRSRVVTCRVTSVVAGTETITVY
jgi:hypothetical protein